MALTKRRRPLDGLFKSRDLKKKLLWTLLLMAITRIGSVIPIPGIDPAILRGFFQGREASAMGLTEYLNFFSGGAFSNFSVLMLGVMPYITAQIIIQILMLIVPKIREMAKDPAGSQKLQRRTRYFTIAVCLIQATGTIAYLYSQIPDAIIIQSKALFTAISFISCTAGSMFLLWIGERITERGVGNGVSLLIFAGIVARIPDAVVSIVKELKNNYNNPSIRGVNPVSVAILFVILVVVICLVIYEETGERRIYVTYSKRIVGNKVYGAQSSLIPFKLNPSGVIPVIFASAVLTFPIQIASMLGPNVRWLQNVANFLNPLKAPYIIIYTLLIIMFAFFYTQVTLNPIEIASQIRENGGTIQGVRPDRIEEYLTKILNRIVLPGSLFLAFIALLPTIVQLVFHFPPNVAMLLGGTSLLIMVGVELETTRAIEGILKSQIRFIADKSRRY